MGASITLRGLEKTFGGVRAVRSIDLDITAGSVVAIIGPNGAGKSTVLKMISGQYAPDSGQVLLNGRRVDRLSAHRFARVGIASASQIPRPFRDLTVRQNLEVATRAAGRGGNVAEILSLTGLSDKADRFAASLGVLDLKRLEVARALGARPEVILLDEIAAGLVGRELDSAISLVRTISATGVTVILVEHVEGVVESVADRVIVLNWGEILADGSPAAVSADPRVREIYLGTAAADRKRTERAVATHDALLEIRALRAGYGAQLAIHGIDLRVGAGEVVALLGANGAGKSTLCGAVSGMVGSASGSVTFEGVELLGAPAYRRTELGVAHCLEGRRLFGDLSVAENLTLGAGRRAGRAESRRRLDEVLDLFGGLRPKLHDRASSLSGGQQQMVAIGRALMSRPRLLICDEVSLGLAPAVMDELYQRLDQIRLRGTSILLVEQNVQRCLDFADRAYVLDRGRISFAGDPRKLDDSAALDEAYFGSSITSQPNRIA